VGHPHDHRNPLGALGDERAGGGKNPVRAGAPVRRVRSERAKRWVTEISRLARLESLTTADAVPEASAQIVLDEAVIALPLAGVIDFAAEKARLNKELEKTAKDIASIEGRLNNPGFTAKAPPAVIEEAKERREELSQRVSQVKDALGRLEAMG
jgi:valyl-tRNA synthetase